jgi:hypothetical protein
MFGVLKVLVDECSRGGVSCCRNQAKQIHVSVELLEELWWLCLLADGVSHWPGIRRGSPETSSATETCRSSLKAVHCSLSYVAHVGRLLHTDDLFWRSSRRCHQCSIAITLLRSLERVVRTGAVVCWSCCANETVGEFPQVLEGETRYRCQFLYGLIERLYRCFAQTYSTGVNEHI